MLDLSWNHDNNTLTIQGRGGFDPEKNNISATFTIDVKHTSLSTLRSGFTQNIVGEHYFKVSGRNDSRLSYKFIMYGAESQEEYTTFTLNAACKYEKVVPFDEVCYLRRIVVIYEVNDGIAANYSTAYNAAVNFFIYDTDTVTDLMQMDMPDGYESPGLIYCEDNEQPLVTSKYTNTVLPLKIGRGGLIIYKSEAHKEQGDTAEIFNTLDILMAAALTTREYLTSDEFLDDDRSSIPNSDTYISFIGNALISDDVELMSSGMPISGEKNGIISAKTSPMLLPSSLATVGVFGNQTVGNAEADRIGDVEVIIEPVESSDSSALLGEAVVGEMILGSGE